MPSTARWRDPIAMSAIVVALGVATIAWGERIGINQGQGWDGISYSEWAQDFWHRVVGEGLTRYHAQRVLPSAVVHYGLRALGQTPNLAHVIRAFAILDVALLAFAAALWGHLGDALGLRRAARWVGFVALFGCFANARHALYYPVLTDPAAFTLGMTLVWAYLTDRPVVVWLCAALGIVTWPALPPLAVVMLVFPRPRGELVAPARWQRVPAAVIGGLGAIGFVAIARHYYFQPVPGVGDEKFAKWVDLDLLPITVVLLVATLGVGAYVIVARARWRGYVAQLVPRRGSIAVVAVAVLYAARWWYLGRVGTQGEGPSGAQFVCELTLAAIRGPLWGLVHHVVYFGPVIAVAVISWRRIAEVAAGWGPCAVIALAMTLVFAAGSNSRQWNHLFPFLVVATIAATAEVWTAPRALAFTALSLAWSKLWLHIGYTEVLDWHTFPNQRYFMNAGPYASDGPYFVHLWAAAFTVLLVVVLVHGRRATLPA